ncbi:MAG: lysophospholipid acyltransferase family protein [Ignavibacteriae bacterium]|jgi:lysophospholipid acyltransferase (LPLAT)-like uncharacterized protein|nr:lysophospholipid acyltransferase family protein [Ignavibacteriota bacterium]
MLIQAGLLLLRLIASTWRYTQNGKIPGTEPSVIAFWHEYMLPGWHHHGNLHTIALVSQSKDGTILSRLLKHWGITTVRGSSSKSGKEALAEAIEQVKNGSTLLLTPDGPRGPRRIFKAGAVIAAQRAEVPLYLAKINESRVFVFQKSWDQFRLPLPFAKINIEYISISTPQNHTEKEYIDSVISECQALLNGGSICMEQ